MFKASLLAACLSSATALLHSAPSRRTTRLEAKKRDYSAGGLGSSKQEQFARLWRDKDAPVEPPVARGVPSDAMPTRKTLDARRSRTKQLGRQKLPPSTRPPNSCPTPIGETKAGRRSSRTCRRGRSRMKGASRSRRGTRCAVRTAVPSPQTTPGSTWRVQLGR